MLCIDNLTLIRAKKKLLNNVSLTLTPGELTVILGPNGAGKSTLLKCCSGALEPDSGSIALEQTPLAEWALTSLAKKRAVLTQQIHMPFSLTAKEVVSLGLAPWSITDKKANQLIKLTLDDVGMAGTEQRYYASLSGGEQQRIQLARVLVQLFADPTSTASNPKYLLLDEPISALDLHQQQKVLRLIKALAQQGLAVFCILHDINLATLYADKIILLEQGNVVFSGQPSELKNNDQIETTYQADLIRLTHNESQLPQWQFRQ